MSDSPAWIESTEQGVRLHARIVPRSSADRLQADPRQLKIRVTAAPVDGGANKAVVKLLAKRLHIGKSKIEIIRGESGRDKVIAVLGIDAAGVQDAFFG